MTSRSTAAVRTRGRLAGALSLSAIALLALGACGSAEGDEKDGGDAASETRSFQADNGTVEIPVDPQRIVATGYAVPVLLEADADLVGISEWSRGTNLMTDEDLAAYEELPKVMGDTADTVNYEAVANAKPDLIVIGVPLPVLADVDLGRLEDVAPVVVLGPDRPDGWKELSRRQADAAGELDYYESAKAEYEEKAGELTEKWADTLDGLQFGHVGGYGDASAGNFQREFAGSWGTNIATDLGVSYFGEVAEPGEGSAAVSEYPSIEELPESLGDADAITYTVQDDGTPGASVAYVLKSPLWKQLPAVREGNAVPLRYTEAATYPTAMRALDGIDAAFVEAFGQPK